MVPVPTTRKRRGQTFLLPAKKANTMLLGKPDWCPLSERRLLTKLELYKPVGVCKNFNVFGLMVSLHYITEDEDDVEFEEYLLPEDYKLYLNRQKSGQTDTMVYPPKYTFRPTAKEILDKVAEFYDVGVLSSYDPIAETAPKEYRFN